jgi:hypothetical protein
MVLDFMLPNQLKNQYETDNYVSSPPANHIVDAKGDIWMLGLTGQDTRNTPKGHYGFNVLRNGQETGECASHIERRNGKIRIFLRNGYWKTWNGQSFT